jgi:hypothetical protein
VVKKDVSSNGHFSTGGFHQVMVRFRLTRVSKLYKQGEMKGK